MRRLQMILSAAAMMVALSIPQGWSQGRGTHERRDRVERRSNSGNQNRGNQSRSESHDRGQRPGSNNSFNSNQNRQPNKELNHNNNYNNQGNHSQRPGSSVNRPTNRPENGMMNPGQNNNRPLTGQRPGASNRPSNRPNTGGLNPDQWHFGGNNNRPSAPAPAPRPNYGNNYGPGNNRPVHNLPAPPPSRPYRPIYNAPYHQPGPPPPSFRPRYHINPLQAILGFTFGTALNVSLNALVGSGYIVDGYANNCIYLRDMTALNFMWPDATLYYNNGYLAGSTFSYSTPYYDLSRYNAVYARLSNMYGAPVSVSSGGAQVSATWWGYDNRYITLTVQPMRSAGGNIRYYTSLTMGN